MLLSMAAGCQKDAACGVGDVRCNTLAYLAFASPWTAVAVGANCTGWVSYNQKTWQAFAFPGCTTGTISSVTYGNGKFVAVGSTNGTTCGIWTSSSIHALQWQQQSCGPTTARMSAVAFGSGLAGSEFVAAGVPTGANFQAVSSSDGITWSDATISEGGAAGAVISLVFWDTNGLFVESSGTPQNTRRRSIGGGTNWVDGDNTGVTNPKLVTGPLVSGNRRILDIGNSPSVVQYSDDAYASSPTNYNQNIFGTALPTANDAVYGDDRRMVFVRDTCGVTYSTSSGGADTSGSYTMGACQASNLKAVGYIAPYFVAAGDDGFFYYSLTGFPAEWSRSSISTAGIPSRVAGHPGI